MHKLKLVCVVFMVAFCCSGCVNNNIDNIIGNWATEFNNIEITKNDENEFTFIMSDKENTESKENGDITVYEQNDGFLLKIEYLEEGYKGFGYELWDCHFDGKDKIEVLRKFYQKENPVQSFVMNRQ